MSATPIDRAVLQGSDLLPEVPHALLMSDLHLEAGRPDLTAIFLAFLRDRAWKVPALFLLGDIFEVWVGDDDDQPLVADVADALHMLGERGTRVYFMAGNRDFLLGEGYARRCGMTRLPDPWRVRLGGISTVLSHGDALCTGDVAYQAFRTQSRDPVWQSGVLAMPLAERRALARRLRNESIDGQRRQLERGLPLTDVDPAAVVALMQQQGATRLIHGHTHRPADHVVVLPGGVHGERIVLSDWRDCGEALEVWPDGRLQRHRLSLG